MANPGLSSVVQEALQRRQGVPLPQLSQVSSSAAQSGPMPQVPASEAQQVAPDQAQAKPVATESEMIIKGLLDLAKIGIKANQQAQGLGQPAPMGGGMSNNRSC